MTGQFAYPPDREEASAKQVAALESLLIEKGVITPQTVDKVLAYFETEMTPLNGKKIVVKAWTDPEFAEKIVVDTPAAIAELDFPDGMAGAEGEHLQAVANTAGDGVRHGACGIQGGRDGQPHRYVLKSSGRPDRPLKTKEVGIAIRPGDVLDVRSGGGGGFGDPAERSPEDRARDLLLGFVIDGGQT